MSRQHFMSKDLDLLESGLFADATITCGDRTWKVHKSIICRCEWFKKAFSGGFEEAQTNNVNISAKDFSPELVDCAISFIYSGVVNGIDKLDTNDSVVDACVRLWVIADFLVLKELQNEAIVILEKHCDEQAKVLHVKMQTLKPGTYTWSRGKVPLTRLFRGIETAYTQYPHAVPCQQVLVSFVHAIRASLYSRESFSVAMSKAPHQFSHELFMATIEGRASKWTAEKRSDYYYLKREGNCTYCNDKTGGKDATCVVDPSMSGLSRNARALHVLWRCQSCFKEHGFERVPTVEEKR